MNTIIRTLSKRGYLRESGKIFTLGKVNQSVCFHFSSTIKIIKRKDEDKKVEKMKNSELKQESDTVQS